MADVKSQKKKAWFGLSLGNTGQGTVEDKKSATSWNPGKSAFKKRSGKGHNKFRKWGQT